MGPCKGRIALVILICKDWKPQSGCGAQQAGGAREQWGRAKTLGAGSRSIGGTHGNEGMRIRKNPDGYVPPNAYALFMHERMTTDHLFRSMTGRGACMPALKRLLPL